MKKVRKDWNAMPRNAKRLDSEGPFQFLPRSSSGLRHLPFKEKIAGSNPVRGTRVGVLRNKVL